VAVGDAVWRENLAGLTRRGVLGPAAARVVREDWPVAVR
jgi:hypothetical protein